MAERDERLIDVGRSVRAARKGYGLTQQDLADLVGTSVRTVRDVERGAGSPAFRVVVDCASAVGLSIVAVQA